LLNDPFSELFQIFREKPNLFGIAYANDAFVAAHLELSGGSTQWNVSFARAAHDWEVDVFASFLRVLHSAKMRQECEDKLWRVPLKRGLFIVGSFYSVLVRNDGFCFPCKRVWQTRVSLRATFFAWSAAAQKIFTMDNLKNKYVLWLISVVCVKGMESPWTILSIVKLSVLYGIFLGCLGLCLEV
jgi:hypothetical protein